MSTLEAAAARAVTELDGVIGSLLGTRNTCESERDITLLDVLTRLHEVRSALAMAPSIDQAGGAS